MTRKSGKLFDRKIDDRKIDIHDVIFLSLIFLSENFGGADALPLALFSNDWS